MKVLVTFLLLAAIYTALAVEDEDQSDGNLCSKKCPQDCGCTLKDGEATCHCTSENHPLIKPPPPPRPPRSFRFRREEETTPSDDDKTDLCSKKCPQDCGCTVNDGEATCHCTSENHPLIEPPPPPPPRHRRSFRFRREEETTLSDDDKASLCRKKCPQDCGCLVNDGEATCHCTAENHPLIRKTPPTPPTPPSKRVRREEEEETSTMALADQAKLCQQKCQPDCGCLVENGDAKCICTAENNPLIKTSVPTPPELLHTTTEKDSD